MFIKNRKISNKNFPYIIAEISANHNGKIEKAKNLIKLAKKNGADAVKIQTYSPESMTIDCKKDDFLVKGGLWDGYSLLSYMKRLKHLSLGTKNYSNMQRKLISLYSTPFDENAVDLLEELGTLLIKLLHLNYVICL